MLSRGGAAALDDAAARDRLIETLGKYNEDLAEERSESVEAQVLRVIRDLVGKGPDTRLAIQDIASEFLTRFGGQYERRVTPRWIGSIVRRRLGLRASRSTGLFTLGPEEVTRLSALYVRFGVGPKKDDGVKKTVEGTDAARTIG